MSAFPVNMSVFLQLGSLCFWENVIPFVTASKEKSYFVCNRNNLSNEYQVISGFNYVTNIVITQWIRVVYE